MSKVSVVVPYFKGASYLEECIQSIRDQNSLEVEILVVDDRDGDPIPESVLTAEHVRHIVLEHGRKAGRPGGEKSPSNPVDVAAPHPFGVAAARNAGVAHATGEYLYFLDADDYLWEDALTKLVKLADEKNAKVVTGNRYSSWFRPVTFSFEKAEADSEVQGIVPLEGDVLEDVLASRFTVQHLLIRKDYYDSLAIVFDENDTLYSDVPVAAAVLAGAGGEMWADGSSIYVWRHHNDPIHLPALCQSKSKDRMREFIESYETAHQIFTQNGGHVLRALDRWLCRFTIERFLNGMGADVSSRYTKNLKQIPKSEWKQIKKEFDFLHRMELQWIAGGNYRMAKVIGKFAYAWKKKQGILGTRIQYWKIIDKLVFQKLKILSDVVLFESFLGKSYSDSPRYIFEYLSEAYPGKYECVWAYAEKKLDLSYPAKQVKRMSLSYFYYMARCRYAVYNGRQPTFFIKRKDNIFLETWHGTPLKKLVFDMDDVTSASPLYKEDVYYQTRAWDYLVAPNQFSSDIFRRAFSYDGKMLETGYPRNDILYREDRDQLALEIKEELKIPFEKKVILYAPTWRDDEFYGPGMYKFSLELDLDRMKEELGDEYIVLLRTHYFIADHLDLSGQEGFAYNVSKYDDVARLYLISDVLITDYSSVFFDYANLRRPMLFFTYDLDKYRSVLRGFYIDVEEELPGPMLFDTEEVIDAVKKIETVQEKYRDRYDRFYEKYCAWEDGHAAERVVNAVFN